MNEYMNEWMNEWMLYIWCIQQYIYLSSINLLINYFQFQSSIFGVYLYAV